MKHEWRKKEKQIYIPKQKPEIIEVPEFMYFTINGEGNPNSKHFSEHIGVLYSLAYAAKMSYKQGIEPKGYFDYTVYPLEGEWNVKDPNKAFVNGELNKDNLVFKLMIRQPNFVTPQFFEQILELTKKKKPHKLLNQVKLETLNEGKCVQVLHVGSFDSEPESFQKMQDFMLENNLTRLDKQHKEIYLSDFRKVTEDKLKTTLRVRVK